MVQQQDDFLSLVTSLKKEKKINSFEQLKTHLSNEILLFYEYDLPKEFNLVNISELAYNYRFMRNFAKTISFTKSLDFLKKELNEFFHYDSIHGKTPKKHVEFAKIPTTNFKQVFFDIQPETGKNIISEDITDITLSSASKNELENVIEDFQDISKEEKVVSDTLDSNVTSVSSESKTEKENLLQSKESSTVIEFPELDNLMKNFALNDFKLQIKEENASDLQEDDDLVNETFKILGLGSIKKNLEKSIITKKRGEGLSLDQWVQENLKWVQLLIKKVLHVDYLSLKDEAHYINLVHQYSFPASFEKELESLYTKLKLIP